MRLLSVDARATGHDRGALAALIESAEADVACVHHGPHLLRWRSISASIGRRSGLVAVGGGRPAGANLLLSTLGVDSLATHDVRLGRGSTRHPAGAALAVLRHGGTEFVVAVVTLLGNAADRMAQAAELQDAIAHLTPDTPPAIVCVLGADPPRTAAWEALAKGTTPTAGRIFVDSRITVEQAHELDGHAGATVPPVVIEARLPQAALR
jgi:hypothetical protein